MEKTLVIVKPDGVQRALVGEIISRLERAGLKMVGLKMFYATKELAGKHYAEDEEWMRSVGEKAIKSAQKRGEEVVEDAVEIGHRVRNMLMDYITMSPSVAMCIEGHNAIEKVRKIVGATNPQDSEPGTIRGDYAIDSYVMADKSGRPVQNLIHASDAPETAAHEIGLWFDDDELHAWKRVDEDLIYRVVK